MKFCRNGWLFAIFFLLAGCAQAPARQITVITAAGEVMQFSSPAKTADAALKSRGITPSAENALLLNGHFIAPEQTLTCQHCTLQIRPRSAFQIEEKEHQTAAFTIGEALAEANMALAYGDRLSLPAHNPLPVSQAIHWEPGRSLILQIGDWQATYPIRAESIGQALSAIGHFPQGLDYTKPSLAAPPSPETPIRLLRVEEEIALQTRLLPFETRRQPDPTLEVDQQAILQAGTYGLAIERTRIRHEEGAEVARLAEAESTLRPPEPQVVAYGTRIALRTIDTPYGPLQYWRAIQMYATSYSPCRSGTDRCYYGTSSGVPVQHGVAAVMHDWYIALQGMRVYVPGYGIASIEDVGGGFPDRRPWIDLGYSDDDYQPWSGWVTVYFLAPAPPEIPWMLR